MIIKIQDTEPILTLHTGYPIHQLLLKQMSPFSTFVVHVKTSVKLGHHERWIMPHLLLLLLFFFFFFFVTTILTPSAPALKSAKCKSFFFRKFIASFVFMLERYIRRPFFREDVELFFIYECKNWKIRSEMSYLDKCPSPWPCPWTYWYVVWTRKVNNIFLPNFPLSPVYINIFWCDNFSHITLFYLILPLTVP